MDQKPPFKKGGYLKKEKVKNHPEKLCLFLSQIDESLTEAECRDELGFPVPHDKLKHMDDEIV